MNQRIEQKNIKNATTITVHLSLTVPEDIDPEEIVETMYMDFFENNHGALSERFPHIEDLMSKIELRIIDRGVYTVVELPVITDKV